MSIKQPSDHDADHVILGRKLTRDVVRLITLSRELFRLGEQSLELSRDFGRFAAVNLVHDAAEAFLIALAHALEVPTRPETKFEQYIDFIEKKTTTALKDRRCLVQLNKMRNASKHNGLTPDMSDCLEVTKRVRALFDAEAMRYLGVSFASISLLDLLQDGDSRVCLSEARRLLEQGDFAGVLVECRKAVYLEFERNYDISQFETDGWIINKLFCHAAEFAKSADYIRSNVKDPSDFIVVDSTRLTQQLLQNGINPLDYWNLWRLTPPVFRRSDMSWVVKEDFGKLAADGIRDRCEYVFDMAVKIISALHFSRRSIKSRSVLYRLIMVVEGRVPVTEKASGESRLLGEVPREKRSLSSDFLIEGLRGDGRYYHVVDVSIPLIPFGYVHESYVSHIEELKDSSPLK